MRKSGTIAKQDDPGVLGVRLSREESDALHAWCDQTGITTSQAVRQIVRLIVGMPSAIPAFVEVYFQVTARAATVARPIVPAKVPPLEGDPHG